MDFIHIQIERAPNTFWGIGLIFCFIAFYYWFTPSNYQSSTPSFKEVCTINPASNPSLTALQQHILFWDRDGDGIIYPHDVYNGFREIGFSIPFSLTSYLIPFFFSYLTRMPHSYIPDPFFCIYVDSIHKAKHGSDSGVYDQKGNLRAQFLEDMFKEFDSTGTGSLGAMDLLRLYGHNRVAVDLPGWTFAAMEWSTTWLLLQREGRVWKSDLRQCYDGSIFWELKKEVLESGSTSRGYGVREFLHDVCGRLPGSKKDGILF